MKAIVLALALIAAWPEDGARPVLPDLDPRPLCNDAGRRGEVFSAQACLRTEAVARETLAHGWASLPLDLVVPCVVEGEATGSYGVLTTCIIHGPVLGRQRDAVDQQD